MNVSFSKVKSLHHQTAEEEALCAKLAKVRVGMGWWGRRLFLDACSVVKAALTAKVKERKIALQ